VSLSVIDPAFFELMPTLIVWNRNLHTDDQWGNNVYAPDVAMYVRVEPMSVTANVTVGGSGTVVSAFGNVTRLICDLTVPRIAPLDKITIVDEGIVLTVDTCVVQYDEIGPYYQEANCSDLKEST